MFDSSYLLKNVYICIEVPGEPCRLLLISRLIFAKLDCVNDDSDYEVDHPHDEHSCASKGRFVDEIASYFFPIYLIRVFVKEVAKDHIDE